MNFFERVIRPLLLIKADKICKECTEFLSGKVIDIGCGRCYIAKTLQKSGLKLTGLDVKNLSQTGIPVKVYDGRNIPFKDNEFNSGLIAYVLHHCDDPVKVLKEAIRICKGNIVIFEDTKPSFITNAMDFISNRLRGVETPFHFKSKNEWVKLFSKLNLEIVEIREGVEKEWFYPFVEHTMFVVRKKRFK